VPLEFAPECCDADAYVELGRLCAEHLKACWHPLRPIGAVYYFSLPFRLGLPAAWIIVLNAMLLLTTATIGLRAMTALLPRMTRLSRAALGLAWPLVHLFFMGGTIRNSLSDGPSAAVAMISMWALLLAARRKSLWLSAAAGGALGLSVLIRAFYLYPALLTAGCVVVLTFFDKKARPSTASFCAALAAPILLQLCATHANTGAWSFIDPASVAAGEKLHFETDAYGYDTLLPLRGYYYSAPECFRHSSTMGDAIRKHEWGDAACLVGRREWFYFGSYVSGGKTYLTRAQDRHFSAPFLLANCLALGVALFWAFSRAARARLLLAPLTFFGASLVEASLIIPEARFMMAVHVALWVFALMGAHDLTLRFRRHPESEPVEYGIENVPRDLWAVAVVPSWRWVTGVVARSRQYRAERGLHSLVAPAFLAPAAAIVVTLVVHGMALGSDLQEEDLRHVYESQRLDTFEFLFRPYGNHFCAFFRVMVAALHWLFGVHAFGYFAIVLLTHVAHVALLYGVIRALTASRFVAAVFAGLWGSAPAFQGTLQWFSAYSHMLGATAVLWSLWELSLAREMRCPPSAWALVRISIAGFLGAATELTGSLTAAFFPLLAFAFLPRQSAPLRSALWLLPSALVSALVVAHFTGQGNAMTLAYFSVGPGLTMFSELAVYGTGLLVGGPFVALGANDVSWLFGASEDAVIAVSTLVFFPLLGVVVIRIIRGNWDERRVLFAMIGFAGFVYAAIAAGRSGLTFGHPVTWAATRDRYHYEATIGLVVAISLAFAKTWPKFVFPSKWRARALLGALGTAWAIAGILAARSTYLRGGGIQEWTRDWADLADASVRQLVRRTPEEGILFVRNDPFRPAGLIFGTGAPQASFPGIGAYWIVAHGLGTVDRRVVRFVVMDRKFLRKIRIRTRPEVAALFVSPGQVERAHGEIRTLEADAPAEVASYLTNSPDPRHATNDHDLANRLRHLLENIAARPPVPFGPPSVAAVADPEEFADQLPRLPTKEELASKALQKAIEDDPKAREELHQLFLHDPKAKEALRKALLEQQDSEE
jgi:hypothetical protein